MAKKSHGVEDVLKVHPIIQKLEAASREESVVLLDGFIGGSGKKTIRIYPRFDLNDYLEIPKDCVVDAMRITNDKEGRTRLFIKASCKITVVSVIRSSIRAESLREPPKVPERAGVWDFPWSRYLRENLPDILLPIDRTILCRDAKRRLATLTDLLSRNDLTDEQREELLRSLERAQQGVDKWCGS